jgi:2',3'-cyclic-nucleotide 2'-phosphodiesterase/3'-nucleotidase
VYDRLVEIRQLIIDWVTAAKTIDPAAFFKTDWKLVANGQPVLFTPG